MQSKIFKNVKLGSNVKIGDYCIIGEPPRGKTDGELETIIGDNSIIRSHTVIYAGNVIGENFQTGHRVMVRESNEIGNDVSLGTGTIVEHHVTLEDGVRIHSNVFIPEFSILKKNSWVGPCVVFTNARYPLSADAKKTLIGPTLEENAKIGGNSTLLPGVKIGKNALVGAGSVVTKDVGENKVVAGNPARVINDTNNLPYVS